MSQQPRKQSQRKPKSKDLEKAIAHQPVEQLIQKQLEIGVKHHQAGQLAQGEACYQKVLQQQPDNADAWHLLGVIASQQGQSEIAIERIERAIALNAKEPNFYNHLANAYRQQGNLERAIQLYQKAVQLQPHNAIVHNNLGVALKEEGKLAEAIQSFQNAIELQPDYFQAHYNLGNILKAQGKLAEARDAFQRVLHFKPDVPEAYNNLGLVLQAQGELSEAMESFHQALQLRPEYPEAHNNLGLVLQAQGKLENAIQFFHKALQLKPDYPQAHYNLGNVFKDQEKLAEAIASYQQALKFKPDYPAALNNLANIYQEQIQLAEAINCYQKAIQLQPDNAIAYINLGSIYQKQGRQTEAISYYQKAIQLQPDNAIAQSNLVANLHYSNDYESSAIYTAHRKWAERYAQPLAATIQSHNNDPNPERPLRIGYVSGDFKTHSVAFFFEPLLAAHNHHHFQIICYADNIKTDATTQRMRQLVDGWREINGLTDAQVSELVRQDGIDILVDLSGHTQNNRLLVFARKPAPIQVSYLGYPNTTGLDTIDYRFTDAYADPEGQTEHLFSEQLIRLPHGFLCYQPPPDCPEVSPSPVLQRGQITFGSFNNLAKINPQLVNTWAAILKAVPESRMIIKSYPLVDPSTRDYLDGLFKQHGIESDRLELLGWLPDKREHLALYAKIDIALDTYPYHGTTTTCEAMWMGVPVITQAGQTHVSRVGVSLLSSVGLEELIAESAEDYIQKAINLASEPKRLQNLRGNLRDPLCGSLRMRMQKAALTNASLLTRSLESSYRKMWQHWCNHEAAQNFSVKGINPEPFLKQESPIFSTEQGKAESQPVQAEVVEADAKLSDSKKKPETKSVYPKIIQLQSIAPTNLTIGDTYQKKAMVVSHERSGTHFLMNTLALNFDYISSPWWNLDFETGLNFNAPASIYKYLKQLHDKPVLNILKSHHQIDFFRDFIDYLCEQFYIFYICRDPRDTMVSFWKFIQKLPWDEGPKTSSLSDFIRSAPCGGMLRYQKAQEVTLLQRWQTHVEGWLTFAQNSQKSPVMIIRYEDLNLDFEKTVQRISKFLNRKLIDCKRPSKKKNVVIPGQGRINTYKEYFNHTDCQMIIETVGETIRKLGYTIENKRLNVNRVIEKKSTEEINRSEQETFQQTNPTQIEKKLNLGIEHHQGERLQEAEACYKQVLQWQPNHADAWHLLGVVAYQKEQYSTAIERIKRAIGLNSNVANFYNSLGSVYQKQQQFTEALECYQKALKLQPDLVKTHNNIGLVYQKQEQFEQAIKFYQKALQLQPNYAEAHLNLSIAYEKQTQLDKAIASCQQAIQLQPNYAEAHCQLGRLFHNQGKLAEAVDSYQSAITIKPDYADAYGNLGTVLQMQGKLKEAIEFFQHALQLKPDYLQTYNNLGGAFQSQGKLKEAIQFFQRALEINPEDVLAHQNLLFSLHYSSEYEPEAIAAEHRKWAERHGVPLAEAIQPHLNERSPARRLRIGYVSGDFKTHSVAYFIEPLLASHNSNDFEVICYANNQKIDATTQRLRQLADGWREIHALNDQQVAELIRQDRIDILVDLSGHTKDNRLLVFARKPAPVQVSYLGYPNTTGLDTIDYRITDTWADPEGQTEALHTEQLIRLPYGFLCYRPSEEYPQSSLPPVLTSNQITFGSFNNLAKVNPELINCWAEILKAIPKSRMILKSKPLVEPDTCNYIYGVFKNCGIDCDRIELIGWVADKNQHLALYNQVDIALDSFPYNGTTTTCEALWMGVPVITLAGQTHVSRVGVSLLSSVGLEEMIAKSAEDYIQTAIALASDLEQLQNLQRNLRDLMQAAPLTNANLIAQSLESAYRTMWQRWCNHTNQGAHTYKPIL